MNWLGRFFDFVLHFDKQLSAIFQEYGLITYFFLFLIIFAETGLVVTPFLPGDSLLFTVGAFAGTGALNAFVLFILLSIAAILGDTVNYWIGYHIGPKVFQGKWFFKEEYLDKTKKFFHEHGKKTIILARFVPVIRTFAPFVAGIGKMNYATFLMYNVIGGIIWVGLFIWLGYFFGRLPFIQKNFSLFVIGIIIVSVIPIMWQIVKHRLRK